MKTLFLCTLLLLHFLCTAGQPVTTIGGRANSRASGICLGAVSGLANLNSYSTTDFARFSLLAGVGCSYYVHATLNTQGAAGTRAGYRIETANLASIHAGIELHTYLNNEWQESASGSQLLSMLNGNLGDIYFVTTKAYDAIRINFNGLLSVAYDVKLYWGFGDNSSVTTLPLAFGEVQIDNNPKPKLKWTFENAGSLLLQQVEKSNDGLVFSPFLQLGASAKERYTCNIQPNENAYYRIVATTTSGSIIYSKTVQYRPPVKQLSIMAFPNPANGNWLYLEGLNKQEQKKFFIFNSSGTLVQKGLMDESGAINISSLLRGLYVLQLDSGEKVLWLKR